MKKHLSSALRAALIVVVIATTTNCSTPKSNPDPAPLGSIWVVNEGNYGSSNARITAYDPMTKDVVEDLFGKANNDAALGDSPTQIVRRNGQIYISLSNSGKAYILDPKTVVPQGKIEGLHSPRCFAFTSATTGYVSNLNQPTITIFDPSTFKITGSIVLGSSVEQMIAKGSHIYGNQWSFGRQIVKIDTKTNKVVDSLVVGIQPNCLLEDMNGNFWTLCDGAYEGSPLGHEAPKIVRVVNLGEKMALGNEFQLSVDPMVFSFRMAINGSGDRIYYVLGNKLYSMSINDTVAPTAPIATVEGASFYSIAIDPRNGDIYCGDAVDYTQDGTVYRFDAQGKELDKFSSGGVSPSSYLF